MLQRLALAMDSSASSYTFPRTVDGLRVAIAGLPGSMAVQLGEGVELIANTVNDLRSLESLPYRLEIAIPYRMKADTVVVVNRASDGWGEPVP